MRIGLFAVHCGFRVVLGGLRLVGSAFTLLATFLSEISRASDRPDGRR